MEEDTRSQIAEQQAILGNLGDEQEEQDRQKLPNYPAMSGEPDPLFDVPAALTTFIRPPSDDSMSAETAAMHFVCAQLNQATQTFPWMTPEGFDTTTAATNPIWLGFLDSLDPTRARRRPRKNTSALARQMEVHPSSTSATPRYLAALRRYKTIPRNNDSAAMDISGGITIPGPSSIGEWKRRQLRQFAVDISGLNDTNFVCASNTSSIVGLSLVARPTDLVSGHAHTWPVKWTRRG